VGERAAANFQAGLNSHHQAWFSPRARSSILLCPNPSKRFKKTFAGRELKISAEILAQRRKENTQEIDDS
jgi:hypothetical protein